MRERLFELSALELGGPLPEVEVSELRFELAAPIAAEELSLLSAAERERAARFQQQPDRVRFVAARRALRRLLAAKLGISPADVPIELGQHSKPFVRDDAALSFSISHSGERGLIALSRRYRVGVDVERVKPDFAWAETARHVLTAAELASLGGVSETGARKRFYDLWVHKEALVKALGTGLTRDLRGLSVDPALTEIDAQRVSLRALDVGEDYSAALAALEAV